MHEATYPCLPVCSPVLSPSDALLARSAAAWKLPHPPPPRSADGGGLCASRSPPPFLPTPKVKLRFMQPDFPSWRPDSLAKFAAEAATRIKELEAANEYLRQDLRDAMELIRRKGDVNVAGVGLEKGKGQ